MIFIDAINVKIRDGKVANRPIYVALAVTCEGHRDILGLWAGEAPSVTGGPVGEGAKHVGRGSRRCRAGPGARCPARRWCLLGVRAGRRGRYLVFTRTPRQLR